MQAHGFTALLCVFLLFYKADALFGYGLIRCQILSREEFVFLEEIYFNRRLVGLYNSTTGNITAYTDYLKDIVETVSKNPSFMANLKKDSEKCRKHIQLLLDTTSKTVKPYTTLKSADTDGNRHVSTLLCSVYNFYPKQIQVSWLRDGKKVTADVMTTDSLSNGNWLYQIHSQLEYKPKLGERVTCVVEHASFTDPQLFDWEPMSESDKTKIAVGTAALLGGAILFLAGGIYYRRSSTGRELVPTS